MASKDEYAKQLEAYRDDETVLMLALSQWRNKRSRTTPMSDLYGQIQPMIEQMQQPGTGSEALKLISQIKSALGVYAKGAQYGEGTVGVEALRRIVQLEVEKALADSR